MDYDEKLLFGDMDYLKRSIRKIDGPNSPIYNNEYRIAMRATSPEVDCLRADVHFMVQTSSGYWAEKHATNGATKLWDNGKNPDELNWNGGIFTKYNYTSEIRYYAISN